jgi:hypothetical protein
VGHGPRSSKHIKPGPSWDNQFKKNFKELLIKGCYYTTEDYLNEDLSDIGY